jgi:alkylation response protein AidB-like acyl-CoA dehydrogenase
MNFEFTQEEEKIRRAVCDFLKREVTPELITESNETGRCYGGPESRKFMKKFAAPGWLAPNWPEEYGGLHSSEMLNYIIREELAYSGAPIVYVGAHMAGPTILRFGNEEIKKEFLPPIARGEIEFALGYTEPQAGSDLSVLNLRAEDKEDHFVLNGQKTFNTSCHLAEYHWLAVRTDLDLPKHKGISMMVVDLKSPGITIRPLITMAGFRTNEVYYDNVIVPRKNLLGEKNQGFYYSMAALDFERMAPPGVFRRVFDQVVDYAKTTVVNGRSLSRDPLIRQKLAQMAIELEVAGLLYFQLAYMLDQGKIPSYQSSMEKTFVTELGQRIANVGMEVLGLFGQLKRGSKRAPQDGTIEHYYRWTIVDTIYGGTSEIQRNIMATRGLGLPRK